MYLDPSGWIDVETVGYLDAPGVVGVNQVVGSSADPGVFLEPAPLPTSGRVGAGGGGAGGDGVVVEADRMVVGEACRASSRRRRRRTRWPSRPERSRSAAAFDADVAVVLVGAIEPSWQLMQRRVGPTAMSDAQSMALMVAEA